jgi:hypothetical protein
LRELEYGLSFILDNSYQIMKFFVLYGIFDKPARAAILNIINSTGYFGCLKCIQEGESVSTGNKSKLLNLSISFLIILMA